MPQLVPQKYHNFRRLVSSVHVSQASRRAGHRTRRDGGGKAEIVGGGHAIYHGARLVTAGDGVDDDAIIGRGGAAGQLAPARAAVAPGAFPTFSLLTAYGRAAKTGKRVAYYTKLQGQLRAGDPLRTFFDGDTNTLPAFFTDKIRQDLGPFWEELPHGALMHDHLAYLAGEPAAPEPQIAQAAGARA